jgi:dUTP pyrophosphatase
MKIKFKKFDPKAVLPSKGTSGSAGYDLVATSMETKNGYIEFKFGLGIEVPKGYAGFIFPRSSVSNEPIILSNSVGVIDSDYRGEIMVRFKRIATNPTLTYDIGERVAQLVVMKVEELEFEEVQTLTDTVRGEGGHGSTNVTKPKK